ncbi:hypothetical protein Q5P01_008719 [Channa striata]|uniref:B30.2/SPRY domain-containing protein n=1 Tax=Channa striata TaxID=64152 RepID=A0AA88SZN2_CHASR|nr:hypothetical protein Q5P01_008719 [Channa striata]
MKDTQLEMEKNVTVQMIQARQQKIREIQNSVEAGRKNAVEALTYSMHVMTAVVDYMKKCQAELTEVIEVKQKKTETMAEGFITELEGEIMQITQKNLELNQVSLVNDPFLFLENFPSLTITAPQVKDWSDVAVNSEQFTVQGALDKLQTTVDGKQVSHGDRKRNLPNKPERFDHVLNVLAKEGFSSGKFYYEVEVKHKTNWDLGVANQSINRKGDIRLSPKNGYWTVWLRKGQGFTANAGPAINLDVRESPQKVGVFVDYDEGEVSFYNVDARAKIFSFTGCNFTEKIFPFFSPCANDGGKNAAPLIITPVTNSD